MLKKIKILYLLVIVLLFIGCNSQSSKTGIPDQTHPALKIHEIPNGVGVNIHFYEGNQKDISMLKKSGIGIVRMDISWEGVERTKGNYDFSRHDKLVNDLEELGIRLLFIIDYGNLLYDEGLAPHTEEGRKNYANFCSALAERYSDKNIIWELWNEPNIDKFWTPKVDVKNYISFCKSVVPAIRNKDDDACIIAPATSAFDMEFMELCFEQDLLELIDGVSVHPYRNPELGPETAFEEYQLLSLLIDQYKPAGKSIPIISGEWGYSTTYLSKELQGKYLSRQWLSNLAYNIPISIWYDWHDDGKDPNEAEHNFGTVTWDYNEKPSFRAMKTFIDHFKGYKPVGRISLGSISDYLLVFEKEKSIKVALWSTESDHKIDLGSELNFSDGVDYLGEHVTEINSDQININEKPIYLNLQEPYPEWTKILLKVKNFDVIEAQKFAKNIIKKNKHDEFSKTILGYLEGSDQLRKRAALFSLLSVAKEVNLTDALKIHHLIVNMNQDILTSKLSLNEIARIASNESMEIVASNIDNPDLITEISLYYLNLAYKKILIRDFEVAEKLLLDAIKLSPPQYAVERVLNKLPKEIDFEKLRKMAGSAGFINDWQIIGPFPFQKNSYNDVRYLFDKSTDITDLNKHNTSKVMWQNLRLNSVFPVIKFDEIFGKERSVGYAYAEVSFNKNFPAILKIGSNDGVVCWINGEKVHENFLGRSLTIDEDIVKVNFNKGKNSLLLKVINDGNKWEACLRICDTKGIPLDISGD